MIIAYQILLFLIVALTGLWTIGSDSEEMKNRCAKICGLGIVSLLITFWLM